jgi:hypothetical protein
VDRDGAHGTRRKGRISLVAAVLLLLELVVLTRRRGRVLAANTVVRCKDGHLFTTLWIPGASVKSLRLGWWRIQYCPVGKHWTVVSPAQVSELTEEEKQTAAQHRDIRVP